MHTLTFPIHLLYIYLWLSHTHAHPQFPYTFAVYVPVTAAHTCTPSVSLYICCICTCNCFPTNTATITVQTFSEYFQIPRSSVFWKKVMEMSWKWSGIWDLQSVDWEHEPLPSPLGRLLSVSRRNLPFTSACHQETLLQGFHIPIKSPIFARFSAFGLERS